MDCRQCVEGYEFVLAKSACVPLESKNIAPMIVAVVLGSAAMLSVLLIVRAVNYFKAKKDAEKKATIERSRYVNNQVRVTESYLSQSHSPNQITAAYLRKDAVNELTQ
jgi:archaellum component FlaF (FlaF/FlaG flagellin family)